MKKVKMLLAVLILALVTGIGWAGQRTTTISWDRNVESDMASYELYMNDALIATVPQPAEGARVTWTGTVEMKDDENVAKCVAVDQAGNKSQPGTSNPFNPPPAQPTGCTLGVN